MVIFHVSSIKLRKMAIIDTSKSIFSVIWRHKKNSNTSSESANKMQSDGVEHRASRSARVSCGHPTLRAVFAGHKASGSMHQALHLKFEYYTHHDNGHVMKII